MDNPETVYLLLTGGDLFTRFGDQIIGQVRLHFDNGADHEIDLIGGRNIREWKHTSSDIVREISSKDSVEVWRGSNRRDAGTAVIDMLTVTVPQGLRGETLSEIVITDLSMETLGELDPAIKWIGATVRTVGLGD